MWFIFNDKWYLFLPVVRTLLPSVLQCLDSHGIEAFILILEKVLNCRYDLIIGLILLPSRVFFHVGEQKIVRWCQIWRIWRINQVKATVTHSSHCNHRLLHRSIDLVKLDSLRQFSRSFWLDFLSQLPQQVGKVFSIDIVTFLKVVNEHNALCIPVAEIMLYSTNTPKPEPFSFQVYAFVRSDNL